MEAENGISSSHAVEVRFKTNETHTQPIIKNEPYWNVSLQYLWKYGKIKLSSSFGELETVVLFKMNLHN